MPSGIINGNERGGEGREKQQNGKSELGFIFERCDHQNHKVFLFGFNPDKHGIGTRIRTSGLTPTAHNYLIRASAFQAQVSQSVEQRTENTGNPRGKFKNRNDFPRLTFPTPELFPDRDRASVQSA